MTFQNRSWKYVNDYLKMDKRIRIIQKENVGPQMLEIQD